MPGFGFSNKKQLEVVLQSDQAHPRRQWRLVETRRETPPMQPLPDVSSVAGGALESRILVEEFVRNASNSADISVN